jgi:hypothetical protein
MVLYRNARRLHPYATCDSCGEHRRHAVHKDEQTKGHICLCCEAVRTKPNKKTIPTCPCCERNNAPFDKHHVFGFKLHRALGREKETTKICLNCHSEITAFLDPMMKLQSLMLHGQPCEKFLDETRIKILQLFIIVVIAYLSLWNEYERCWEEDLNIIHRFLRKLKRPEEIREAIGNWIRKLEGERTCQKQIEAPITILHT